MKRFFLIFIIMILVASCASQHDQGVDTQVNEFITDHNGTIALFPTYEYIGSKEIETNGAYRTYHLWGENSSGKYIMIQVLNPKGRVFPENIIWIDMKSGIHFDGDLVVYDELHDRPASIIAELDMTIQPASCYLITQQFDIDDKRKEAIFKLHIVPDDSCVATGENAVKEFRRVIIKR